MSVIKELVGLAQLCIKGKDGTLYKIRAGEGEKPYTREITVVELDSHYGDKETLVREVYDSNTKRPGAQLLESFLYWAEHIEDKW